MTGVVTGLGTAAVKTAADFDSAMSKVAAVSGATGSDFDKLRDKAREMEDMLSGIEGVMYLAAASGEDLATTSDIVTDALTAFGLTAGDSGHFADVLAAASSNANTNAVSYTHLLLPMHRRTASLLGITAITTLVTAETDPLSS